MKRKLLLLFCFLLAGIGGAWADWTDVTSTHLTNADLSSGTDGWTTTGTWAAGNGTANGTVYVLENYSGWGSQEQTDFALTQTVTLPAGIYKMTGYSLYGATAGSVKLVAKNGDTTISSTNPSANTGLSDNSNGGAGSTDLKKFANSCNSSYPGYLTTIVFELSAETSVTLGYVGAHTAYRQWFACGPFALYKYEGNASSTSPIDFTTMIYNPGYEDGSTNGWTTTSSTDTGARSTSNSTYAMTNSVGSYLFNTWWQGTPCYQTISDLPTGKYTLSCVATSDGATIYLINGDNTDDYAYIETTDKTVGQTLSKDFLLSTAATNYKVGIIGGAGGDAGVHKAYQEGGYWWYKCDDFHLTYYGNGVEHYATAQSGDAAASTWYALTIEVAGTYKLTTDGTATIVYTQDGSTPCNDITTSASNGDELTLSVGTIYYKASAATALTIAAASYSYTVGTATADKAYIQPGQTVTVTYSNAATNNTSATFAKNGTPSITLGETALDVEVSEKAFTFTVPDDVTAGTDYTLTIPAGAFGYATGSTYNEAQTITLKTPAIFDQTAYVYSPKNEKFLSRGDAYGTAAILDNYGIPVKFTTTSDNKTTIQFVDNALYLYGANWAYSDAATADAIQYTIEVFTSNNYTGYKFISGQGATDATLYVSATVADRLANNSADGTNVTDNDYQVFQIKTKAERDAIKTANILADHVAIASAAGKTITDEDGFTDFLGNYSNQIDKTSSVSGAELTESLDAAWTASNVRKSNTEYAINSNGTEFYESAETFTQTVTGLDEGVYKVTLNGYFREGSNANCVTYADYDLSTAYLKANDYQINMKTWASDRSSDTAPNGQGAAKTLFDAGKYLNTLYTYVGSDGKLTLTICNPNYLASGWMNFENLTLTLYCDMTEEEIALANAKTALKTAIAAKPAITANIAATAPFNYNKSEADTYNTTLETAQGVYDSSTSTKDEVDAQTTAVNALTTPSVNLLSDYNTNQFYAILKYSGWNYNGYLISFYENSSAQGGYSAGYYSKGSTGYIHELTLTANAIDNTYTMSFKDNDNNYRYLCTGTVYGGNAYQLRTTNSEASALKIKIIPSTTTEDIVQLYNTEANAYIGSQDIGLYTVNSHNDFQLIYVKDINKDGTVKVDDVEALAGVITGSYTDDHNKGDINDDNNYASPADLTALIDALKNQKTVSRKNISAMVYTEQSATDNASDANKTFLSGVSTTTGDDLLVSDVTMTDYLTTLNINASAISGTISSVSVYANDKTAIAGPMSIVDNDGTISESYTTGDALTYASNQTSDVVTVTGSRTSYTAYLRPVALESGVTITVRTEDGNFYSQNVETINAGQSNDITFNTTTASNNWMATIPGNTYFSFLSTPGAHDAATSTVSGSFSTYAKCQSETIAGLLANGVRAFDLRPGYKYSETITASNLYIYHGTYNTNVLYVDAIKTLADFVKDNPSEAISIIMVKESASGDDRSSEMWSVMNACHTEYAAYMKVLDHSYYTLDDFRGKICFVNRNGTSCTNTVQITNWPDDDNITDYSAVIAGVIGTNIQDKYNTSGTDKQTEIKTLLTTSSSNTDKTHMYYNICSSAYKVLGSSPETHAKTTNPAIATYLKGNNISGPTGYLYADFMGSTSVSGGADLLHAVINQNYNYVYTGRSSK